MSVLSKIGGFFEGLGALPGDVLKGLKAAWSAVKSVWSFLVSISQLLTNAWTWVVNGIGFLGRQVGDWAGEVFSTLWDTLTSTIPKAIEWVFDQAVKWAENAVKAAVGQLRKWVDDIYKYVVKLIHDLVNAVKAGLHDLIKWVTAPVRWVLHWGAWLIHLITHPENLANWIASAILEPVVKWFLKAGSSIVVWLLRSAASKGSEVAHLFEDVLHDML